MGCSGRPGFARGCCRSCSAAFVMLRSFAGRAMHRRRRFLLLLRPCIAGPRWMPDFTNPLMSTHSSTEKAVCIMECLIKLTYGFIGDIGILAGILQMVDMS